MGPQRRRARGADSRVRTARSTRCGDACPIYPGKRYKDWELEDPAGKSLSQVRQIRDAVDVRVRQLLAELVQAPQPR
jgi:protein-tyrosine-phosphatase